MQKLIKGNMTKYKRKWNKTEKKHFKLTQKCLIINNSNHRIYTKTSAVDELVCAVD